MFAHTRVPPAFRRHTGYGLLEVMLVLVLAIGGSMLVFTLYQDAARPASDTNAAVSQLQIIKSDIAGAGWLHVTGGYSTMWFDNEVTLKSSNLFPADMYSDSSNYQYSAWAPLSSPWGGDMYLGVTLQKVRGSTYCKAATASVSPCYGIIYSDAPPSECQRLVMAAANLFPDGILVGGTIYDNVINAKTGKINQSTLASKCNALASAPAVDQEMVFLVH